MQKKLSQSANGKTTTHAIAAPLPAMRTALLGRAVLLRHPYIGRGIKVVAGLIVGLYTVDDRYVIVQAFPVGKPSEQFADVHLLDADPGETQEPCAWLAE